MPDTHTHIHTHTHTNQTNPAPNPYPPSHPHTQTPIRQYQLALHVLVAGRADEDGVLHQAHEAPEGATLILDLRQQGGHQVGHALAVAHVRVKHGVVQQNPPGGKGWRGEGERRRPRKETSLTRYTHWTFCISSYTRRFGDVFFIKDASCGHRFQPTTFQLRGDNHPLLHTTVDNPFHWKHKNLNHLQHSTLTLLLLDDSLFVMQQWLW